MEDSVAASHRGRPWSPRSPRGGLTVAVGVALIVAALVLIASEPVDRTKVALAGAVLVLLTRSGSPSRPASTRWLVIQHWWHDTGEL